MTPVLTISLTPYGLSRLNNVSNPEGSPANCNVKYVRATSTILQSVNSAIFIISIRWAVEQLTLIKANSRLMNSFGLKHLTFMTGMILFNCFSTCSTKCSSPSTTIVILDIAGFSVMPTAKLSILNPRLENNPETFDNTPK